MALAVNTLDVATPDAFVIALVEPVNAPLAPEPGAANVTVTPDTGLPEESLTVAANGLEKGALIEVLWPLPLVAVILAAGPGMLVSGKLAGVAMPVALAMTL